jgi:lysophospholipase L1-like esterase
MKTEALAIGHEQSAASEDMSLPRWKRVSFSALAVLLALVIAFAGLEIGLRIYCAVKPNADVEFFRYANLMKSSASDSQVGFMHQPNTNLRLMGVDVAINSRGFRDVEHPQQKAPGTTRIALLGDSVTFGWGVQYGQRYSEIIAQRWNEASPGKFELICTGHGNYNSRQEYGILSDYLAQDGLDGVIQFWYINDAEPLPHHRDAPWYSHFYTAIFFWSKTDLLQRRLGGRQNYVDYYRGLYQDGAPGLAAFKLALSQTGAWTREREIPWVFVIMPEFHDFSDGGAFAGVYEYAKKAAADAGAIVVDVTSDFKGQDPRTIWVAPNDVHPNAKGHAIIGDAVVKKLDPSLFIQNSSTKRK